MKFVNKFILVVCFVVGNVVPNVKESVVTGERVASIYENPSKRDGKCHSFLTPGLCTENGNNCSCHSQCCSGICDDEERTCVCNTKFSPCTKDRECCVGKCKPTETIGHICDCAEISEDCDDNDECCKGFCDTQLGFCYCIGAGNTCSYDKDCCHGYCENNKCECAQNGAQCADNRDCCNDFCYYGTCISSCAQFGDNCLLDEDCCRGVCDDNFQCVCGIQGDECSEDIECCNGVCVKGKCTCAYNQPCNPEGPVCCFGKCSKVGDASYACRSIPLYEECYQDFECESLDCVHGLCSCLLEDMPCDPSLEKCCPFLTCDPITGACVKPS